MLSTQEKRRNRHKRVRAKIFGTLKIPRLCVFRSSSHIYAQIINDEKGETLVSLNDLSLKKAKDVKKEKTSDGNIPFSNKAAKAFAVGSAVAEKALEKKIKKVVFDRGGYKYYGRVKALAQGARSGGLQF